MAVKRSASGFVCITSVVVVSAVSLVAIVGRGNASSVIDFLHGGAWVSSRAGDHPKLHHVNANGKVDFSALADTTDPMRVANTEGRAVAVNTGSGLVTGVDLSTAEAQASALVDDGTALLPVGAAGHLYLVDPGQGTVRAVAAGGPGPLVSDPVQVRPGAPDRALSDRPGVDDGGTLWVSAVPDGIVVPVTSERPAASTGAVPPPKAGRPLRVTAGADKPTGIEVSIVSGQAYVLVRYENHAEVAQLRIDQPPRILPTRPGQPLPPDVRIAPRQGDSAMVNLLDPGAHVVRRLDPDKGEVDSLAVPVARTDDVEAPVTAGGKLIFVDDTNGHIVSADPNRPGAQPESHALAAPGGLIDVVVKDGTVVANDPDGNKIVTYDHDGNATESEKFVDTPAISDLVDKPSPPPQAPKPVPATTGPVVSVKPVTTPPTAKLSPPGDPVNLRSAGGQSQVILSWQASLAGGAAANFVITAPDGNIATAGRGETTKAIPAANGNAAVFTIRAENPAGRSRDVAFPPAVPQSQVPGPPTGAKAVPGDQQITLSWFPASGNGTAVQGYRVLAGDGTSVDLPGPATATATLKGLTNGTDYAPLSITALARTSTGADIASQPATLSSAAVPFGKPLAPTGVTASAGNGTVIVSFPPANGNGDRVSAYDITLTPGGQTHHFATSTPLGVYDGPIQDSPFTRLSNGTPYIATVTATNRAGTGPPSTAKATPLDKPTVTPGATSSTTSSISLDFTVNPNGSAPDSCWYRLNSGSRNGTSCTATATVGGLSADTPYTLAIGAHNAAGDSTEPATPIRTQAPPPPTKWYETTYSNPSPTKTWQGTNASGPGPDIAQNTKVEVTCRKYDPTVTSNAGGWWYQVASPPWNNNYWAPAGDFFNGSATALWDPAVPVC